MAPPSATAKSLASLFLRRSGDGKGLHSLEWQMEHRLQLVSFWEIQPGSRILEIGCGQGDCTLVLADAVGENGHVDALDPGSPDYGSPFTLGQSQSHILQSPFGSRITFHNTSPEMFLNALPASHVPYDYVILSHCIWYFETPAVLNSIVSSLASKTKALCLAEWSLRASRPQAQPHVLTAMLLASLEAKRKVPGHGNIRTILSPVQIKATIVSTGSFALAKEEVKQSNEGLLDGYWEVSHTLRQRQKFMAELRENGVPEKEVAAAAAAYDAVEAAVGLASDGVGDVKSMDVWAGSFDVLKK